MEGLLTAARRRAADERGVSLLISLMVSLVVLLLGATWMSIGTHATVASGREALKDRARNAAEGGLNLAMSQLAADFYFSGQALTTTSTGEYEISVAALSSDPFDGRRVITATGYAPSKTATRAVTRRLSQQVELVPTDGFRYALFAAPGGITGDQHMTVIGDVYSRTNLSLSNNETITGDVTTLGSITTSNKLTVTGKVHAGGAATIDSSSTVINGDLLSGGNVSLTGYVKGSVQAAGTISGGTVDGSRNPNSAPSPPAQQSLPAFTWDEANYPAGTVMYWTSPEAFEAHWSANKDNFTGHHRITCSPSPCTSGIELDSKWKAAGDVSIVSDSTITLSRDFENKVGGELTVAIMSFATASAPAAAVTFTNAVVLPDVNLLVYAPNGPASFGQNKSLSGAVYAKVITVGQHFTLDFVPLAVPGFSWALAHSSHYEVVAGPFRELP